MQDISRYPIYRIDLEQYVISDICYTDFISLISLNKMT